jgi:mannose-6-phosphate isomerase-like protein (cupin superfamily)
MPTILNIDECPVMDLPHGRGKSINLFNPSNATKNVDVHINVLNPGVKKGAIHYHKTIENVYIILEGNGTIVDKDGKVYPIRAGQAVFLKPGENVDTHEIFNTGTGPLKLVEIYSPPQPLQAYGGKFDPSIRDHHVVKAVD